ncbi:cephalosporin esterase [Irpex lacteus]|nr:cephalosporin esterase [Irpex lacteus]
MFLKTLLAALHVLGYASIEALCTASSTNRTSPTVDLGYAIYEGTYNQTTNQTSFLGIRYAAPPVDQLRFQAPSPPLDERSLGIQKADTVPVGCLQSNFGINQTNPYRGDDTHSSLRKRQSMNPEDCLLLSVWTSGPLNPSAKMPVIVWIHGGGYVQGDARNLTGDDLVREAGGGIVVVTLEYRLGVFGFLAGQQVKQKGALNLGLLDQQAAFRWVQRNIHLFGGSPAEVTIWGESAGAGSVIQHLVAHGGNTQPPLFKAAITGSTFLPSQYNYSDRIPEQIYSEVVRQTGCENATDTFQCLVDVDVDTLQQANLAVTAAGFYGTFVTVPVVDGEFIQGSPTRQIYTGRLNGERYLGVTNAFEGTVFVSPEYAANKTLSDYVAEIFPTFNETQIDETTSLYNNISTLSTAGDRMGAVLGESIFICPTYLILQHFRGAAFKAEFSVPPGTHGEDIVYYFPHGVTPPFPNPEFVASFAGAMAGFAKFGDPNVHPVPGIITPHWYTYADNHTEMLFNRTEDAKPEIRPINTENAMLERCAFWVNMSGASRQ